MFLIGVVSGVIKNGKSEELNSSVIEIHVYEMVQNAYVMIT